MGVPKGALIGLYSGSVIVLLSFLALLPNARVSVESCCAWSSLFWMPSFIPLYLNNRKRWEADKIHGERKNYIFDLDYNELGEEGQVQNRYSVDGYTKGAPVPSSQPGLSHLSSLVGNWARFIK